MTSYFDDIYIANSISTWLYPSSTTGSVAPSGSTVINLKFKSTNIVNGTYFSDLYVNSNDPANPVIIIPCTLTVNGLSDINISLSGPCPSFDTIMVGDSDQDTLLVQNVGCDTLFISNVTTSSTHFVVDTFPAFILPYSNSQILISFQPTTVANHVTTITVLNNDADTSFCLQGVSLPAPTISTNPTFFNAFIACGDSLTDTLFIYNSGAANLNWSIFTTITKSDDFDPAIDPSIWLFNSGFTSINCGSVSGNALYFNDNGVRQAETIDLNTIGGGNISFYIRLGNGGSCEYLDPGEDVVLEYSNNAGGLWINISTYYSGNYFTFTPFTIPIPVAAQTTSTRFRWRQISHSGSSYDNWALDNVSIDAQLTTDVFPSTGTTLPSGSDTVFVEFNSTGFNAGQYFNQLTILSNDPANGLLTIPCTINVVGNPDMQVSLADIISPSCLDLDSIMEYTTSIDSLLITNTGCDTLIIDSLQFSSAIFTFLSGDMTIAPGNLGKIRIKFSPVLTGNYTESLTIYTNDIDTAICLKGKSFQRPIQTHLPVNFDITLGCNDSITDTLTIYNTGGMNLDISLLGGYAPIIYDQAFVQGVTPGTQATAWAAFRSQLNSYPYTSLKISGSNNPTGITLTDPASVLNIANALRTGSYYSVNIGGNTWKVNTGCGPGVVLSINAGDCSCDGPAGNIYIIRPEIGSSNWGGINTATCNGPSQTMKVEFIYGYPWLNLSTVSDTIIPSDSSQVVVTFNSTNILIGDYYSNIIINSNDPLNNPDSVPVTLHVVGAPQFNVFLHDSIVNCLNLDSIMEFTSSNDTISIFNTGCDTLFIDSLKFIPTLLFSAINTPLFILPGDTGNLVVEFSPVSTGNFSGTVNIYSNDADPVICLEGIAYPRPVISVIPDTFNITINVCQDTVSDQLMIINSGLSDLQWNLLTPSDISDDFDPAINTPIWSVNNGFISTNCGSVSGNGLYFNDNGVRQTATIDINTSGGGNINFYIRLGDGGSCEYLDPGEDVVLEYSNNGGGLWTNISTFYSGNYFTFTPFSIPTPLAARTTNTRFRWIQLSHSGSSYDNWALDNVSISAAGQSSLNIIPVPYSGTTVASDTTIVTVFFTDSGLVAGNYNYYIYINSNDPFNSVDTVMVNLTVDSLPSVAPNANDTSICFGTPTPDLIAVSMNLNDTIKWYNSSLTLIYVGDTLVTGETAVGAYVYYAISIDSVTGCESQPDTVYLNINSAPVEPLSLNESSCFDSPVPVLNATGTIPLWYNDGSLTTLVYIGNPYNTGLTATGTYTFYVADSTGGCPKSLADTTTLTIYTLPNIPVSNDTTVCVAGPIPSLTATVAGTDSIRWYNSSMVFVGSGYSYNTGQTTSGIYKYYVSSVDTLTGCESSRDSATLTIVNTAQPVSGNASACFGSSVPSLSATGTNILWYDSTMTLAFTGDPYNTGLTSVGIYPFYVTQTLNGCESSPLVVTLTINPIPSVPVAPDENSCFGQSTPSLTATGANIKWYSDPTLISLIAIGSPYNTGMTAPGTYTYYVTQTVSGCQSLSDTVTLNIFALPSQPVATDEVICFGNPTPDLVATSVTGNDTVNWYNSPALTPVIFTGNPFTTGETAVGTYTYYVTQTDTVTGCRSNSDTVTLSINAVPLEPTANDVTICFGLFPSVLNSTGTIPQWYNNASLTPVLFAGSSYNTGITAVGTYTFYVTDSIAGCPQSPADTAILTINSTPVAPVASPQSSVICFGEPNSSFSATGTNIEWWSDPSLTTLEFAGDPFTPSVTLSGTYSYYVTQTTGSCTGPSDTVTYTINALPVVNLGNDSTQCGGTITLDAGNPGSVYLWSTTSTSQTIVVSSTGTYNVVVTNINGCSNTDTIDITILSVPVAPVASPQISAICLGDTNPSFSASGTNIEWWGDPSFINLLLDGDPYTPLITTPGTYSYYVTQTVTGCRSSSDTIQFTINYTPVPIANNVSVAFGSPVPDLTATGNNIQWFDTSMSLVYSGSPFPTGLTAIGTDTFYVSQTMNSCESTLDTVILTIYPGAPLANDETICFGQTVPDLTATGTNIQWFSDSLLTMLVGTGSPFATGQTAAGSYIYYVTQTVNSVQSPGDIVILTINSIPSAPVSSNQSTCSGGIVPDLTAIGTNIQWYDSTMTPIFSGSPFTTGQTTAGTYIYIVTQSLNGCESIAIADTLTIYPLPSTPITSNDTAICFGDSVPNLTASGINVLWYDTSGVVVGSGNSFAIGQTAPGIYFYYATQTDILTTCESLGDIVTITINSSIPPVVQDVAVCFGLPVPPLTATGAIIQWYDTSGVLLFTGNSFNTGQSAVGTYTYYVTQTSVGTCESPKDTAFLIINSPPTIAPTVQDTNACFGSLVPDLVATTGTLINWYSDSLLTNLVYSGNPFSTGITLIGTYNYFATDSTPGCPEGPSASVSLIINALPTTLSVGDTSVCFGNIVPDLTAIGTNVQWFDTSMVLIFTGNTFVTGQTATGNYIYLVTQSDLITGCLSIPDSVTLTINTLPAIPIAIDTTVCSASNIPDLTANGNNVQWYDTLGTIVFNGNSFATGQTNIGIYSYYVSQTDVLSGCESYKDTSVLTILLSPPVPTANDVAVCTGNPVPSLTSTGTNVMWFSDVALTVLLNSGNTFNTGQTGVGIYTYFVTDSMSGCISSSADSVTLFINPVPLQPFANDLTLCYGEIADLNSTGTNPQWYSDATLINIIGTGNNLNLGQKPVGNYTYYVADYAAGCGKSTADTVILTINPNPLVTVNTFSTSIFPGDSVTLVAYNALTYIWTPPTGLNTTVGPTVIASPSTSTTYTVIGTNIYGCSSDTNIFVLLNPIGVEEINISLIDLKIYPNPASKQFTIEFSTLLSTPINIYINNIVGEKVKVLNIEKTNVQGLKKYKYEISTEMLADGFYSIEILTSQGTVSRIIVLKK